MRFLLINPYYPISETPSPPLGLAYLGAALEAAGVEVRLLDLVIFPYSKKMLESVLQDFSPQFVGSTAVTMTFDHAAEVIKDVKGIDPSIWTVMGGPHVTFCAMETMRAVPELDFICLGEGEDAIVQLIREAENGCHWHNVKGCVYRQGSEVHSTGFRDAIPDMDAVPTPARALIPLGRYRALHMPISMTTSRGCPFQCIFCVGRRMVGPRVRYRSPARVVDELEYLTALNFHQINIADDLFTANKKRCLGVCDEIIARKLKAKWTCFGRVDTVSPVILERMKQAGCDAICFGVESANAAILKTIKKGITTQGVLAAVAMCRHAGITPHASFILGLPGETPETLKETTDFGKRLKDRGAFCGFHLLAPFPGTEVHEEHDRLGIKILTSDWSQYHANRAIVETPSVNREMLDGIVIEWEDEFKQWLGEIKRRMGTGEATEQEASLLTNLAHTVLTYDLMMGRVIEEKGSWRTNGQPLASPDALKTLVDRVASSTRHQPEDISSSLAHAAEHGNLRYEESAGKVQWRWVDYL
ncbi:MAG: B12-binding domain-containing radical SAM protein [Desulfobacterales bacterium]|nr:B12-binding domain-containing radical SAM protein [Desulfobacterales bacterium]